MTTKNGKVLKATEGELFGHYLKSGFDTIMSFPEYKSRCIDNGTEVIEENCGEAVKKFAEELKAEAYNECDELMASIIAKLIDNCLKGVEGE